MIAVQFKQATSGKGADKSGYRDRSNHLIRDLLLILSIYLVLVYVKFLIICAELLSEGRKSTKRKRSLKKSYLNSMLSRRSFLVETWNIHISLRGWTSLSYRRCGMNATNFSYMKVATYLLRIAIPRLQVYAPYALLSRIIYAGAIYAPYILYVLYDTAILVSISEGAERAAAEREKERDSEEDDEDEKGPDLADIETHSSMAENMKIFLLKNSSSAAAAAAVLPVKRKENLLPRTFYEFNVASAAVREGAEASEEEQPLDLDPIPLTIMKSKRVR